MNIQKYKVFLKVVEYGSITRTAEELNYTQSGVSRMIAELEKAWSLTLLERRKSGIELTSDGMKLLPAIKRICNEEERLRREIDYLHDLQSGFIRIGTFSSVATHWLPRIIKKFQKDYPKIEFELLLGDYQEIEQWITNGRVDFGFMRLPATKPLEIIPLTKDRLLVVMPQNHPLSAYEAVPIEALGDYPFMLLEKGTNLDIADFLKENDISPDVQFRTWDDYSIMSMVENELGIGILPELILQRTPYHIETRELSVSAYREIGLAMRNREALSLAGKKFISYVLAFVDQQEQVKRQS